MVSLLGEVVRSAKRSVVARPYLPAERRVLALLDGRGCWDVAVTIRAKSYHFAVRLPADALLRSER